MERQINRYEYMLPADFAAELKRLPVVYIPTGLLEWHGDHLPLGLDALKAHGICCAIAEQVGGGIVMPPNYFGRPGFSSYVGTMTFSEPCIDLMLTELLGEVEKLGARVIVMITGHYGPCQVDCIKRVAAYFMKAHPSTAVIAQPEYEGVTVDGEVPADHAGKWETSMLMALHPELVDMERFRFEKQTKQAIYPHPPNEFYNEPAEWVWKEDLAETASPALGRRAIDTIARAVAAKVRQALDARRS